MLQGPLFQLTLTSSNWREHNFEKRKELKETSSYMEAGFGNFCEHFGVTDHLIRLPFTNRAALERLTVYFHFYHLDEPHAVLEPVTGSLTEQTCLHLHMSLQLCTSWSVHVLECSDGLWHSADITNIFSICPLTKTTAYVECR